MNVQWLLKSRLSCPMLVKGWISSWPTRSLRVRSVSANQPKRLKHKKKPTLWTFVNILFLTSAISHLEQKIIFHVKRSLCKFQISLASSENALARRIHCVFWLEWEAVCSVTFRSLNHKISKLLAEDMQQKLQK